MSIEYKIKLTITGCISAKKEGKMRSLVLLLCFVKKKKMTTQRTCTGTTSSEILYRLAELVHFTLDLLFCLFVCFHLYHFSLLTTLCICYSIKRRPKCSLLNTFPSFIFSISPHFSFLSLFTFCFDFWMLKVSVNMF